MESFNKNKSQKKMIIGTIIGIIFIIVGITIYKTYGFYREEKVFNVLQGKVPNFSSGDLELAFRVDGKTISTLPEDHNYVVFIQCGNGVEAFWDYDDWKPEIRNIKQNTKCTIDYLSINDFERFQSLLGTDGITIDQILLTNIEQLVTNKEAMVYLAKSPELVNQLKSSEEYTEEVKKKILNSNVISEEMKYNAGLPCYLYKNGEVLSFAVGDFAISRVFAQSGDATYGNVLAHENNGYCFYLTKTGTYVIFSSDEALSFEKYSTLALDCSYVNNTNLISGEAVFGASSGRDSLTFDSSKSISWNNTSEISSTLVVDVMGLTGTYFIKLKVTHGTQRDTNSVNFNMLRVAVY